MAISAARASISSDKPPTAHQLAALAKQRWQLRNVARYASRFIKTQRVSDSSIARIGVAIDISEGLSVGINDLEARIYSGSRGSAFRLSVMVSGKPKA